MNPGGDSFHLPIDKLAEIRSADGVSASPSSTLSQGLTFMWTTPILRTQLVEADGKHDQPFETIKVGQRVEYQRLDLIGAAAPIRSHDHGRCLRRGNQRKSCPESTFQSPDQLLLELTQKPRVRHKNGNAPRQAETWECVRQLLQRNGGTLGIRRE